jgi:hypothetical protein
MVSNLANRRGDSVNVADAQAINVHIDLGDRDTKCSLHTELHDIHHAAGYGSDARPILDDHIDVNNDTSILNVTTP